MYIAVVFLILAVNLWLLVRFLAKARKWSGRCKESDVRKV